MTTLFGDLDQREPSELLDPTHWFRVIGDGPYRIRNITKGQTLAGEYETRDSANRMVKRIAARNPRFQV